MSPRHLITIRDVDSREVSGLLRNGLAMKAAPERYRRELSGRSLAMIFEKPSLRTRVTFELAMFQLGGTAVNLAGAEIRLGQRESVADVTRCLARWVDGILVRTFRHGVVEEMARCSGVPVINGLTDLHHPCQALADLLTMLEAKKSLQGLRVTFVGDGNNVAHSLALGASRVGIHLRIVTPPGYEPLSGIVEAARGMASDSGARIEVGNDLAWGLSGTEVVYTDVWTSMGQEGERESRNEHFLPFRIDRGAMARASPTAIFMHCLPAHRGEEVTDEVADSEASVIFQQAENRLHMQKAVLLHLMSRSGS